MATNIVISLDTRRKRESGVYPIIFRITHNTKTTSITTGYSTKENEWDNKKRSVKKTYKGTESPTRLNNHLQKRKSQMMDVVTKLADKGQLTFLSIPELKEHLTSNNQGASFRSFTEKEIKNLFSSQRIGTAKSYQDALNAVMKFCNKNITFEEINLFFLQRFEVYHLSKGNKPGGLAVYMRTIRAIYNKAIKAGFAEVEAYPFQNYTIKSGKPRKRAMSLENIQKIKALNLDGNHPLYRDRNIFLLSFYLRGMPYTDMAHLKIENIVNGRVEYCRRKTSQPLTVKIPEQAQEILAHFMEGKKPDEYILDVIKRDDLELQYKDVKWAIIRYNRNLKKIAKLVGIEETLTSYVSRHSYASIADDMEVPLTAISQMLGHQEIGTTQAYLDSLRSSKLDKYQEAVLEGI